MSNLLPIQKSRPTIDRVVPFYREGLLIDVFVLFGDFILNCTKIGVEKSSDLAYGLLKRWLDRAVTGPVRYILM